MGRHRRSHLPGTIFHLVSRTHRREAWFTPDLCPVITLLIRKSTAHTDARLLAYAVMPNHLHVIVRQGRMPLSTVMQPLLRRVAHRVQRHHGFEGAVVERRYRDRPCTTPDHVREAIAYTHLNPWRAELCDADLAYEWSSHAAYLPGADPRAHGISPHAQHQVLALFANGPATTRNDLCRCYLRFVDWRIRLDRYRAALEAGDEPGPPPFAPDTLAGDENWQQYFVSDGVDDPDGIQPLPDIRDFVLNQLTLLAPGLTIDACRGPWLPRRVAKMRQEIMRAAANRGFRTGAIARFFMVAPQTVSRAKHSPQGAERAECGPGPIA